MGRTTRGYVLTLLLASVAALAAADAEGSCEAEHAGNQPGSAMLQLKRLGEARGTIGGLEGVLEDTGVEVAATHLHSKDFVAGTLRITKPGKYVLSEDIVFDPQSENQSFTSIPVDCPEYPQLAGYFLGFFAALSVEADDVELDCDGHEIKMSAAFHKRQRFFSVIELGSSPFKKGQGPPQFASNYTTPAAPAFARNVVIKNCRLGLSSHHSIHGNDNVGVTVQNVAMYDFEVAGVALNGAFDVVLDSLQIGPSLKNTFRAGLSQAIFLDHLAETLMEDEPACVPLKREKVVTLRGQNRTAQEVFDSLRAALKEYLSHGTGPLSAVAGDGKELPDGSAVYGVLLHRAGVAIGKIGVCPDDQKGLVPRCTNNTLRNISISSLDVNVDQVTNYVADGKIVAGPAGDVFQVVRAWNATGCFEYGGNVLMDAEIAMGALCEDLAGLLPVGEYRSFCGGTHMPASVRAWAAGEQSCAETTRWATSLTAGTLTTEKLTCAGDAMNHHNKGAIGLRLGFQEDIEVENVVIKDVRNHGVANAAPHCSITGYEGVDVRAASLAHVKDLHVFSVKQQGALQGTDAARVFPITGFLQMRADDETVQG